MNTFDPKHRYSDAAKLARLKNKKLFLFDIDGTIAVGDTLYEGSAELIRYINDVKYSFNSYTMNRTALALGVEAIRDHAYFEETRKKIIETREWTKKELRALGFTFGDSMSNFIFASHERVPATELFEALRREHIYVRHFTKERINNYLRISIGTREEMETFIRFLKEYLKEA